MLELNLNLPLALPPHESTNASGKQRPIKDYYTGKELYELGVKKIPMLVEGLFLKTGIMVLAGSSDVGKSTLARQLILSIAEDRKQFLGWNLNLKYNKAIYVSTEDDSIAISYALNKTVKDEIEKNHLDNIRYVFDSTKLLTKLEAMLKKEPVDCIVIDAFADIYDGELNQLNKVRSFLSNFFNLVERHGVLIIFVHHTGKRTEALPPSKNNLIGSQGIEGRARQVIELRMDPLDSNFRHLCLVKGNFIPEEEKKSSYKLKFNEDLSFEMTGERTDFNDLAIIPEKKNRAKIEQTEKIVKLIEEDKLTFEQAAKELTKEGKKIGKSTVNNIYRKYNENKSQHS